MDLLPSLEVGVEASGNRYGKYTMEGVGNYDTNLSPNITEEQKINRDFTPNYWLGARSSWEIDAWGKLKNKKIAAQKKFLASAEGLRLLQVELFTDIANLYYQLVALDNRLAIYQKNYNLQQRALRLFWPSVKSEKQQNWRYSSLKLRIITGWLKLNTSKLRLLPLSKPLLPSPEAMVVM